MGQKMYNVTIQGITKQYPEKIPYSEIVKEYEGSTDAPVKLVIVNLLQKCKSDSSESNL